MKRLFLVLPEDRENFPLSRFSVETVLLKVLIFNMLLDDGYPKRRSGDDVRC